MIRYSLQCVGEHEFEAWFSDSAAYDKQRKKKLVECPVCGSTEVKKQIMAPSVRSSDKAVPAEVAAAKAAAEIRQHIETTHDYVGDKFAEEARKIHFKDVEARGIYGEATPAEIKSLTEDGVPIAAMPPAPPKKSEVN